MCKSEKLDLLASALVKAQASFMGATKDAKNPFFKSTYATLNAVWEAVAPALADNGLTVLQPIVYEAEKAFVQTTILHVSGQFITGECPIVCAKQNDPQALGSAITYARRYSLASMLGVMTTEDDDAEKAIGRTENKEPKKSEIDLPALKGRAEQMKAWIMSLTDGSVDESCFKKCKPLLEEMKKAGWKDEYALLNNAIKSKIKKGE